VVTISPPPFPTDTTADEVTIPERQVHPVPRSSACSFCSLEVTHTSSLLASCVYMLALDPSKLRKLQAELDLHVSPDAQPDTDTATHIPYLTACIKESLRVRPSTEATVRKVSKDTVLPSGLNFTPAIHSGRQTVERPAQPSHLR